MGATPSAAGSPSTGAASPAAGSPTARAGSPTPGGPTNTPAPVPTPTQARSKLAVPATDSAITASDVTFPGQGTTVMAYLARPGGTGAAGPTAAASPMATAKPAATAVAGATPGAASKVEPPYRAVLVCHENRGLTEHIKDVTRRLAKAGYVALAVDLLSRDGGTAKVDPAQVPGKLGNPEQHVSDFQAGLRHLQSQSFVDRNKIGMVGFCFGGGITWLMAVNAPELKAAVPFYGPPPPAADIAKIRAAVLAIYAGNDARINAGSPAFEEALKKAGVKYTIRMHDGAEHGFMNDTGQRYDKGAAEIAWVWTVGFLAETLKS